MKKVVFLGLFIALTIGGCIQEKKSPIEGVWQVVGWQGMVGDSVISKLGVNSTGSEMIIFSKNNFLWVGRYKADTIFWNNYGGGEYKIEGNRLEEKIKYSEAQSWVGTTIRLQWELKNDTAFQTWPFDENWQLNKKGYSVQKWIRLE